jgi:hypothetical protein
MLHYSYSYGYHDKRISVVGSMLLPPHKFARLSLSYYRLQEFIKYDYLVVVIGVPLISNFVKIRLAFLQLKHAYG